MYKGHFELAKYPFGMTPDPSLLFMTQSHREALAGLAYAILERKGFIALVGDAGTGKTTLVARILEHLPTGRVQSSVILNPTLTCAEFLEMMMMDFGIKDIPESKASRVNRLQKFLLQGHAENKISVLVVDEAHKLSPEVLEEIRLLGNLEFAEHKLLQIVLAGQSELAQLLNRPDMRQLKQRFSVRLNIESLTSEEVEQYVTFRWTKSGGKRPTPFMNGAVDEITRFSKGIPRVINCLCDNALMRVYGHGERHVTGEDIVSVARELDLLDTVVMPVPAEPAPAPLPLVEPVHVTVGPPPVLTRAGMQTLERYSPPAPRLSFFSRWGLRLGRVNGNGG
jgi:general secretion pathway protein A